LPACNHTKNLINKSNEPVDLNLNPAVKSNETVDYSDNPNPVQEIEISDYFIDSFDYFQIEGKINPDCEIFVNDEKVNSSKGKFKGKVKVRLKKPVIIKLIKDGVVINQSEIFDYEEPAQPSGLEAVSVDANRIELRWNQNNEDDLSGYNLYYTHKGSSWKKYNKDDNLIKNTECTLSGLHSGNKYKIRISAVDRMKNESSYSDEIEITTSGAQQECCD
ncbi:fibronectin type III domain-containing protein, partial [Candidatus Dependentiae bacterium]|nr:fibronectin type III domain-containing protein [Candidatus Dependentiae bacterium]